MTSISQQPLPPQAPNNVSQPIAPAQSPGGPVGGKATPQAAGSATVPARNYANATKKTSTPSANVANPSGSIGGGSPAQYGKPDMASPVNGRNPIIPAVPTVDSSATVNGGAAGMNSTPTMGDHGRQPSVTINATGASGHMPNGGSVAKPAPNNRPQFGTFNPDGSPAMTHATPQMNTASNSLAVNSGNPRVTSPTSSPSPIPQPPQSGGSIPSTFQGQGNGLNFGSINGDEANRQLRPTYTHQGMPTGPQASHLRRDSSHSQHSEYGNPNMGPGPGRGGYQQQGSRRGGYGNSYSQQPIHSPGPNNFRANSNQSRGPPNMPQQYQQQARPLSGYPPSPYQAARSPALANVQPAINPQQAQMHGQMQMSPYMYSPYPGYPPNMNPQAQFPQGYSDPQHVAFYMQQQQQYYGMPPNSPQPQQQPTRPGQQQQYFPGQYGPPQQGQTMSRTSSAISGTDRSASTMGVNQGATGIAGPPQTPGLNRPVNSPGPKAQNFTKPRKATPLVFKDPTTGAVVDIAKATASPGPSKSPGNVTAVATPPPRSDSQPDLQHHRTESKSIKSAEEKKNDAKAAIAEKIEAVKRQKELEDNKVAEEMKAAEEAEAKARKDKDEAEAKKLEAAEAQSKAEEAEKKAKAEAEQAEKVAAEAKDAEAKEAAKVAEQAKDTADAEAKRKLEEEEEIARWEAEAEAAEAKERELEEQYQKKKKLAAEEKARKEAEAAKNLDDDMKKAEREAEAIEEARIKKLEESEGGESQKESKDLFASLKKTALGTPSGESPAAETPEESGTATPASETTSMAPPAKSTIVKPKPAALKLETTKPVEPGQRSAQLTSLLSARRLLNIKDVAYPAGFQSPNPALNTGAPAGKFNYDRNFLMQFSRVFVEKPSDNWETQLKTIMGDTEPPTARSANAPRSGAPGMGSRNFSANVNAGKMGQFGGGPIGGPPNGRTLPPGTTSADRFNKSTPGLQGPAGRGGPMQNPFAQFQNQGKPGGFPMAISKSTDRAPSHTGMGAAHPNSPRGGPSQRGGSTRGSKRGQNARESDKDAKSMPITAGQQLEAIKVTASGWKPHSIGQGATGIAGPAPGGDGQMAPDVVQRKVKSNLNKMTPQNFPKISAQILDIAAQSKDESDGRTLRQVIQLTFEKATDEAHWAAMYAEFCQLMLQSMSPEIKDENILDKAGNVVVGGALFRKYLLNRCQTEFEQGWKINLPDKPEGEDKEEVMLSDEYYKAATAKRRGLGLVRFIGELYKLSMLTERIMHQCVHKLVDYEGIPDEAEVESLTSLLKTIGGNLEANNERGASLMDAYFQRIQGMIDTPGLPSRLRFMLMDIVDLRKAGWRSKDTAIKGPTTLDQVREQAAAAEREKEMERMRETASRRGGGGGGGRPPIGRGDARNFSGGGAMPPPEYRNTVGMDDLKRLQSRNASRQASAAPQTFGPSSMFSGARGSNTRKPLFGKPGEDSGASSRTATPPSQKDKKDKDDKETSKNAFSALASLDSGEHADSASPAVSPPSIKVQPSERQRSKSPLGKDKDDGKEGSSS